MRGSSGAGLKNKDTDSCRRNFSLAIISIGMAKVTVPVLKFNLFDLISIIWDSVIIKKDSSKRVRVELVIFRNIAPAPTNPAFATCSFSLSFFFFSLDSASCMASSANLGRRMALQEYTPWQSTHGASSMLISSPIRTSEAVAFGRDFFFRPKIRCFFFSPFSPVLLARFLRLALKLDPNFFALLIVSFTISPFDALSGPASEAWKASPCERHSLTLRDTFRMASERWRVGVQSISISIVSPSWMVDPIGKLLQPEVRMATGFIKGKETAEASTDPFDFFARETSNVTVIDVDSAFAVSEDSSGLSALSFEFAALGKSRRHVTVQFPRSISNACSFTVQKAGSTAVISFFASSEALSVVRARSSFCSRVDHISAFRSSLLAPFERLAETSWAALGDGGETGDDMAQSVYESNRSGVVVQCSCS
mmetsp:Transcript_2409/g.5361  ORF Transcript_2409/g.5361 Transcript_2409/m.5361 type:complete len:423 (+) Transcript_2409:891-2159(+)